MKNKYMKIIIEQLDGRMVLSMSADDGVQRSDVAELLSLALCSTLYQMMELPKDIPEALKKKILNETADLAAEAVKSNFLDVAYQRSGVTASFINKEAEFMAKLMGL